jgi:hypothetical protein
LPYIWGFPGIAKLLGRRSGAAWCSYSLSSQCWGRRGADAGARQFHSGLHPCSSLVPSLHHGLIRRLRRSGLLSHLAAMASSVVLVPAAFSAAAAAIETSLAIEADPLLPNQPGAVDTATLRLGNDVVATLGACCPNSGGPLTMDPSLWNCLILLYRGTLSSSNDTSVSLSAI